MAKRIIYCADGTWDAPGSETNVFLIYKALASGAGQEMFYNDGTGADSTDPNQILEGAFGQGLFHKIQVGYTAIADVYEPGNQIYLFGFSRGAYTVRSLAGMIANCGLPTGNFTPDCVTQVFAAYRDPTNRASILAGLGACALTNAPIQMIGVWDTVGSLGIPAIFGGVDEAQYGFLDTSLHPDVQSAYQALAIDEARAQFPATLWTSTPAPGQTLVQVWFSGCHGDVGGGTPQGGPMDNGTRLCDITLGWMIGNAQAQGLTFKPAAIAPYATFSAQTALDAINQTWTPVYGPRHLRPIAADAQVANSVALRVQSRLSYEPGNLNLNNGALGRGYSVVTVVDEGSEVASRGPEPKTADESVDKLEVVDASITDATEPPAASYRITYAAFEGDIVGFDQRSFGEPLRDSLGADVYAGHLAQLIVARKTPLPLSLGLFGEWGAGKSYFMRLLHQKIDQLTARDDEVFCRKVVQIHLQRMALSRHKSLGQLSLRDLRQPVRKLGQTA